MNQGFIRVHPSDEPSLRSLSSFAVKILVAALPRRVFRGED
jgi:hypothetical protein